MKQISVPINLEAMSRLDYDSSLPGDLIEYTFTDDEYHELCQTCIFDELNSILLIMIDDFEDEVILNHQLEMANSIVSRKAFEFSNCKPLKILKMHIDAAIKQGTAVFIYF